MAFIVNERKKWCRAALPLCLRAVRLCVSAACCSVCVLREEGSWESEAGPGQSHGGLTVGLFILFAINSQRLCPEEVTESAALLLRSAINERGEHENDAADHKRLQTLEIYAFLDVGEDFPTNFTRH